MEIKELEEKMLQTMSNMVESLDMSVAMLKEHPEHKNRIKKYWTDFGKHFLSRVKKAEKETGEKILSELSLMNLVNLIK